MKALTVKSRTKTYKVRIENDYQELRGCIRSIAKGEKLCIVYDAKVNIDEIKSALRGYELFDYPLQGGETVKTETNFVALCEFLFSKDFSRKDTLLAVGGGSISDLVGFTASAYMRGINYATIPTTLLSAVDACIGGKTAIDLKSGKNVIGSFYPPSAVYVAAKIFSSLPREQTLCGKAEAAKYALLSNKILADELHGGVTDELIYKCLAIKKQFVQKDEFDLNERKLLNLGHSVAHAYESASGFTLSHGEAVARGLYKIIDASAKYFGYGEEKTKKMKFLLSSAGFDDTYAQDFPHGKLKDDKKAYGDKIDLILLKDVGAPVIARMPIKKAEELLEWT